MDDLVTIAYHASPVEIAVLKDRFDSEGIAYIIRGENNAYPSISAVQGGITIQVRSDDEERALEIVKETGYLE